MHGAIAIGQLIVTVKYSVFMLHYYLQETSADTDIKDHLERFVKFSILNINRKIKGALKL